MEKRQDIPSIAQEAVLLESEELPQDTPTVRGYDWNSHGVNYEEILRSYTNTGFQATNFGKAIEEIRKMVSSSTLYPAS